MEREATRPTEHTSRLCFARFIRGSVAVAVAVAVAVGGKEGVQPEARSVAT